MGAGPFAMIGPSITVPAPAYSYYGGNITQTNNFNMQPHDTHALTNSIVNELSRNSNLVPTKAPGDFSAGVQ